MESSIKLPRPSPPRLNEDFLLGFLQEEIRGILWVGSTSLEKIPPYFYTLDYLLDGLLVQNLRFLDSSRRIHFFGHENFSSPFFLAHIVFKEDFIKEDLLNLRNLIRPTLPQAEERTISPTERKIFVLKEPNFPNTMDNQWNKLTKEIFKGHPLHGPE